jgi:hypothetical protein
VRRSFVCVCAFFRVRPPLVCQFRLAEFPGAFSVCGES